MMVVRLSASHNGRIYSPGNTPGTRVVRGPSRPHGHNAAERIMAMINSYDYRESNVPPPDLWSSVSKPHPTPYLNMASKNLISTALH